MSGSLTPLVDFMTVTPPTVAIWTSLFDLYLVLGTMVGIVVISVLTYSVFTKPKVKTEMGPKSSSERRKRIRTIILALITISILTTVELDTFSSASLVTVPSDPSNSMTIQVVGQQFFWTFIYPNNYAQVGNLTIPVGETIILNITSKDVFHSFAIQQLDVAKDAIPGRYNQLWLEVPTPSNYSIICKELCGVGHAFMTAELYAVNATTFNTWYSSVQAKGG